MLASLRPKNRKITSHYCGAMIPGVKVINGMEHLCFAVCRSYPDIDHDPNYYQVKFLGGTNEDSMQEENEGLFSTLRREGREEGDLDIMSSNRILWDLLRPRQGETGRHFKTFSIVTKFVGEIPTTFDGIGGIKEISGEYVTRPVWRPVDELLKGNPKDMLYRTHQRPGALALWWIALRNPPVWNRYRELIGRHQRLLEIPGQLEAAYDRYRKS